MLVVRKEEYLGLFRQLPEHLKPRRCTLVIEIDEQIVGDERQRRRPIQIVGNRGDSQREIELVGRAGAHSGDGDFRPVRALAD